MTKFFPSIHTIRSSGVCISWGCGNMYNQNELVLYLSRCKNVTEEFLIDTGVHKFFNDLRLKDYPPWWASYYYRAVRAIVRGRVFIAVHVG